MAKNMIFYVNPKELRTKHFSRNFVKSLDYSAPKACMVAIAQEIVKNCFSRKYVFRSYKMTKRFQEHGVLPKSFFRQNFLRIKILNDLLHFNEMSLDDLLLKILPPFSDLLIEVVLFDGVNEQTFYQLNIEKVK